MAPDEELLRKARDAGSRLKEAERQILLARAEYHTLIRRLHLAGASLREIAHALALSHQRVQQIVDVAGGTWWQRIWRTRNVRRDAVCTFCERPPSEVGKLIAGPNVYICDACVGRAERDTGGRSRARSGGGFFVPAKEGTRGRCAFCGKRRARQRPLLTGPNANICGECMQLCRQILSDRAT